MAAKPSTSGWVELAGGILVRQSRAYAMNSALLLDREHAILVDPGVLPSEIDEIADAASRARPVRVSLFLTHAHWDHVLARPWWPDAEIIAHDRFGATVERDRARILDEATKLAAAQGESWTRGFEPFKPQHAVSGLHYTRRGPWHLVFRDAFGHCPSQLTLHLPDRGVLFAADMLSDIEIPSLEGPVAEYRATLETLRPLAEHDSIRTLVPGHGGIARGRESVLGRLNRDLGYLDALEDGVRKAAASGRTPEPSSAELAIDLTPWGGGDWNRDAHADNVRVAWESISAGR